MALEVLGETKPSSAPREVEYVACPSWQRFWQDTYGVRMDKGECLWEYTARVEPGRNQPDCPCRRNRR